MIITRHTCIMTVCMEFLGPGLSNCWRNISTPSPSVLVHVTVTEWVPTSSSVTFIGPRLCAGKTSKRNEWMDEWMNGILGSRNTSALVRLYWARNNRTNEMRFGVNYAPRYRIDRSTCWFAVQHAITMLPLCKKRNKYYVHKCTDSFDRKKI